MISSSSFKGTRVDSRSYVFKPKSFKALNVVASATSSGGLFIKAAIISTVIGREHGSLRLKLQNRWRKVVDL